MKNTLSILSILLIVSFSAIAQKKNYTVASIAFYNLENLFDPADDPNKNDEEFTPTGANAYTYEIYQKKLQNLSRVLSEIATEKVPVGPSIIGVAEIENEKVLLDLVQEPKLRDRNWRVVHFEGPDVRGVDVGLLYNPAHFKVIEAKSHLVDIVENGKKEYTRDILQVKGLLLGDTIDVLVGHWPSRRGGEAASAWKRKKAAQVCKDIHDALIAQNPNAKVVIMGDLNDDPVSPSVTEVLGAKGNKKDVKKGGLFNPFYSYFKQGYGTLGYSDSWNLFDQIIISSGFLKELNDDNGWKFLESHVFAKNYLKNQFGQYKGYPFRSYIGSKWNDGYSDHFPTYIYLVKEQ